MSSPAATSLYAVDTSALMGWQARFYPPDVFPGVVIRVEALIQAGRMAAPELVREEIESVGTLELRKWVAANDRLLAPNADVLQEALAIQARFPGLLDPKSEYEEADAYVIALAGLRGGIVVAEETSAAEKRKPRGTHYIPDVCRDLGIPCINLLGLMRREGWTFV